MQSHYEINVSKDGRHLFATHERSCLWESDKDKVLSIFKEKFPEKEGYSISIIYWKCVGEIIE